MTHRYKANPQDEQSAHSGKVSNDHNKQGETAPTQRNEARRTPQSRPSWQGSGPLTGMRRESTRNPPRRLC